MLLFFYEETYKTGFIFFPLFILGLIGWIICFEFIYFYFNPKLKNNLKTKIDRNFSHTYLHYKNRLPDYKLKEKKKILVDHYLKGYQSNLQTIKIITVAAPLLGLLGTVNGMIKTFDLISLYGNGNPIFIADGISEALLTTQAGITIAFPLLLSYNFCQIFMKRLKKNFTATI